MAAWKKLLARMVADPKPRSYTYTEAAGILFHLGFQLAKTSGSSHRVFRLSRRAEGKPAVVVGLLDTGRGTLPAEYVKDMVQILRGNDLLPDDL